MKLKFGVKELVATAIGAALFFVLGRFVAIPSPVPNTSITLQYGVLAFFASVFGPIVGLLSGVIGHFFIDFSMYGSVWWSWVVASAVCGIIMGFGMLKVKIDEGEFNKSALVRFLVVILIAHLVSWVVIAPVLDVLFFAEPVDKVFIQGLVSAISNFVTTAIVGGLLCFAYSATIPKKGSLKEEE